jgi:hypothetical protein
MVDSTPAYEWIFSGIGLATASVVAGWLYRRYRPVRPTLPASQAKISNSTVHGPVAGRDITIGTLVQQAPTTKPFHDEYRTNPTADDIAGSIQKVPLYLRESVSRSYVGIKVRWQASIFNIFVAHEDEINVALTVPGENGIVGGPTVIVKVKLSEYPILKTVHGGEALEVLGTINHVQENFMVFLKDVTLIFPPR